MAAEDMECNTLTTPQENELAMLTHSIIEWRRLKEENDTRKVQVRDIGALDLKNSGGRVLFKKQKRQAGLGQKTMERLIAEHLESHEKAQHLMNYIKEHREVVTKESIHYEKTDS